MGTKCTVKKERSPFIFERAEGSLPGAHWCAHLEEGSDPKPKLPENPDEVIRKCSLTPTLAHNTSELDSSDERYT